jgi:antitoxin ParD1/3/4
MAGESKTVTMNVSVPKRLKRYVDRKVSSGDYGSASEFVREAIREKRQREQDCEQARAVLSAKLVEGIDSGNPIVFNDDYISEKKRRLIAGRGKRGRS